MTFCVSSQAGSATTTVVQLTDVHLDMTYTPGTANADCGASVCCMSSTPPAASEDNMAGYWGGIQCDLPVWTFRDMLEQIRERHQVLEGTRTMCLNCLIDLSSLPRTLRT